MWISVSSRLTHPFTHSPPSPRSLSSLPPALLRRCLICPVSITRLKQNSSHCRSTLTDALDSSTFLLWVPSNNGHWCHHWQSIAACCGDDKDTFLRQAYRRIQNFRMTFSTCKHHCEGQAHTNATSNIPSHYIRGLTPHPLSKINHKGPPTCGSVEMNISLRHCALLRDKTQGHDKQKNLLLTIN